LSLGRCEEGEELLQAALSDGDEGAGLLLLRRFRVAERIDEAKSIAGMLPRSFRSAVELSKLYERGALDLERALRHAADALSLAVGDLDREASAHRLGRIERKLAHRGIGW
jgi:hypothetical protein